VCGIHVVGNEMKLPTFYVPPCKCLSLLTGMQKRKTIKAKVNTHNSWINNSLLQCNNYSTTHTLSIVTVLTFPNRIDSYLQ